METTRVVIDSELPGSRLGFLGLWFGVWGFGVQDLRLRVFGV